MECACMRTRASHGERSESVWMDSTYGVIVDVVTATGVAVILLLVMIMVL